MDLEEVVYLLKQDKSTKFEYITLNGTWADLDITQQYTIVYLFNKQFRVKKEKIKRYQIIYKDLTGNFSVTDPSAKFTKEEFEETFKHHTYSRIFHAIIPQSAQEYDE